MKETFTPGSGSRALFPHFQPECGLQKDAKTAFCPGSVRQHINGDFAPALGTQRRC